MYSIMNLDPTYDNENDNENDKVNDNEKDNEANNNKKQWKLQWRKQQQPRQKPQTQPRVLDWGEDSANFFAFWMYGFTLVIFYFISVWMVFCLQDMGYGNTECKPCLQPKLIYNGTFIVLYWYV